MEEEFIDSYLGDEEEVVAPVDNAPRSNLLPVLNARPEPGPSFFGVTKAALSTTNSIGSTVAHYSEGVLGPREDFDFDSFQEIKGTVYEPYYEEFLDADTQQDVEIVKARIDRRLRDQKTLKNAGILGTGMDLVAAVADPINLFGFGLGAKAGISLVQRVKDVTTAGAAAKGAMINAVAAGATTAVSEGILLSTNELRANEEMLANIGIGTAIGAVLGGTLSGVTRSMRDKFAAEVAADVTTEIQAKRIRLNKLAEQIANDMNNGSIGAAAVRQPTLEDLTIKGAVAQYAAKMFKKLSPQFNLAQSPSLTSRRLGQRLMTSDFVFNENAAFYATPHSIEVKLMPYDAMKGYAIENLHVQYRNYKTRVANESKSTGVKPLTYEQFDEAVGLALMRKEASDIPEVAAAAKHYRDTVFDEILERAQGAGLLAEDIQPKNALSYFPTQYDYAAINADRQGLRQVIMKYLPAAYGTELEKKAAAEAARDSLLATRGKLKDKAGIAKIDKELSKIEDILEDYRVAEDMTEADFADIADEMIGHVQGLKDGLAYRMRMPLTKGPLKYKKLDFIPQEELAPWTKTRASEVTDTYLKSITPEIEFHKEFGGVELKSEIAAINAEYADLINKTTDPKKVVKLQAQRDNDIKDIEALVGRLRGTYGRPTDADGIITNALQVSRALNVVTKLGGTSVSMLPDLGRITAIRGFRKAFSEALLPMINNMKGFKASVEEARRSGAIWETVLNNNRALNMAELVQPSYGSSRIQRGLQALTDRYSKWNLTNYFEKVKRQMSSVLIQNEMVDSINKVVTGKISQKQIEQLAASGIDEVAARRIAKMLGEHSEMSGSTVIANTQKWTDRTAVDAYHAALNRQILLFNTAPTIGTRPRFMSSEIGKTLLQFESFNLAATSKIMVAGLQQADARTMSSMLSMVSAGMMVYAYRQLANGHKLSDDPSVWIAQGFENSGIFGAMSSVNDRLAKVTNGRIRAGAFIGAPGYGSQRGVDPYRSFAALLGPSGQTAVDFLNLAKLIDDKSKWSSYDTHSFRQSVLPTQNFIGGRFLWDEVEDAFNSAIGVN